MGDLTIIVDNDCPTAGNPYVREPSTRLSLSDKRLCCPIWASRESAALVGKLGRHFARAFGRDIVPRAPRVCVFHDCKQLDALAGRKIITDMRIVQCRSGIISCAAAAALRKFEIVEESAAATTVMAVATVVAAAMLADAAALALLLLITSVAALTAVSAAMQLLEVRVEAAAAVVMIVYALVATAGGGFKLCF